MFDFLRKSLCFTAFALGAAKLLGDDIVRCIAPLPVGCRVCESESEVTPSDTDLVTGCFVIYVVEMNLSVLIICQMNLSVLEMAAIAQNFQISLHA